MNRPERGRDETAGARNGSGPRALSDAADNDAVITAEARQRFGDYVLVARLSEDALGTVYRAIHLRDGRFARLRLLETPELNPAAVFAAIGRRDAPHRVRSFHPPGRRETLGVAEGRPYLAWRETSGWTLDTVLAAARQSGTPFPIEGALRIVAGAAAALEHARATVVDGEPARHGLVWPGFVTVSRNAEVWVRGFGLAPAVLPSLGKPRLSRLIAPYIAPEARERCVTGDSGDVYSLGVLLLEILTGQRPSLEAGPPDFSADDPFSEDVALLARSSVADAPGRLSSVVPLRERLERLIENCPYEGSNADLVLCLDDILKPERSARSLRPRSSAKIPGLPVVAVQSRASEPGATRRVWALRITAAIAAIATLAGVDFAVHRQETRRSARSTPASPSRPSSAGEIARPIFSSSDNPIAETPSARSVRRSSNPARAASRALLSARRQASGLAQLWRLRAALSRVAAQRIDAWNLASEPFRAGRIYETEGERLLSVGKFAAADEAFERAAGLYLEAEELSHAERARVIRISTLQERPSMKFPPF